jgi:hypothetical protein
MKSLLGKLWVILGYMLVVMVLLSLISCEDFINKEVMVYPVSQTDKGLLPLKRINYKAIAKQQTVIYWTHGSKSPDEKLVNCVVRDRLNWSGELKDGSAKFAMVNGKFSQTYPLDKNIRYVSKWKWWILKIWRIFK